MPYLGPKFSKDQLIFVVDCIFAAAFDRIDSYLPHHSSDVEDFKENEREHRGYFDGCMSVPLGVLPFLYCGLTGDGMGIGDFRQADQFEDMVREFIETRLGNPDTDFPLPESRKLAEEFVNDYLSEYLK